MMRIVSPSSPGAWVAPLPVTAGIFATSASASRLRGLGVAAGRLDQPGGHALLVVEQRLQQMGRSDPLLMLADRNRLRGLEKAAGAVGELLKIHRTLPLNSFTPHMVWQNGNTR